MHRFRKQKRTFSGTCSNRTIAAKIGLVVPGKYVAQGESGKMVRVLCDKLQEMKEKSAILMTFSEKRSSKLDINIAFS